MAEELKGAFKGKDVERPTACRTIICHAIDNAPFHIAKRPIWADPILPDLRTRIDNACPNILGVDNAKDMRQATAVITGLQKNALRDLAEFKIQIDEDFKKNKPRRTELLNTLGFTAHLKDARNKDQEALVELLFKFKTNMTPILLAEINAAGMSPATSSAIIGYADALKDSNITQETLKANRKSLSAAAVAELNAIYDAVISIARISAKFFKDDKAMAAKFSYEKTLAQLNPARTTATPPTPTP